LTLEHIICLEKWINTLIKMIVVKVSGGLGNQLFQYAAGRAMSIRNATTLGINSDSYAGNKIDKINRRVLHLSEFKAKFRDVGKKELRNYLSIVGNKFIDDYFLLKIRWMQKKAIYDENTELVKNNKSKDACLIGTFANPSYFSEIKGILQKEIELTSVHKIKRRLEEIKKVNSVSVHVRRGDLTILKEAYLLPIDYYKAAIAAIGKKVKNPIFFIFSDDISWCKKNFFWLKNKYFIENTNVSEDLELMKNCKNNILANSTLSWWAAYLNKNKNKIVIQPSHMSSFKDEKHTNLNLDGAIKLWAK